MSRQPLASAPASHSALRTAGPRRARGLGPLLGVLLLLGAAPPPEAEARSSRGHGSSRKHRSSGVLLASRTLLAKAGKGAPKDDRAGRRAQELVKKGDEARGRALWAQALLHYQQAYDAKPLPAIQRQIGDCHRGMGNAGRAAFAYHQYLKYAGEVQDRREVEELAQRMDELAAQTRGTLQADAAPETAQAQEPTPVKAPADKPQ